MYVIITSKPGVYRAELEGGADAVESYEYLFYGRRKAIFRLVRLDQEGYVRITEEDPPHVSNRVRTKFLEHFDTLEQARQEIDHLIRFGCLDAALQRRETPGMVA